MQLKSLLFFAFAVMVAASRVTVPQVLNDLRALQADAGDLSAAIQVLNPGNFGQELDIQNKFTKTKNMIDSTDSDVQNTSTISDADAEAAVNILKQLVDTVVTFLSVLVSKVDGFGALEKSFIKNDLTAVGGSIQSLEVHLSSKCPPQYQETAAALKSQTDSAFNATIQAFS